MSNLMTYLQWRGDLTFTQDPPNEVDALVFSALAYISYGANVEAEPLSQVTLKDAAESFFAMEQTEGRVRVKQDMDLLYLAASSVRFGQTKITMYRDLYIPEQETQFAAMTFLLDDGSMFLAFRGTDYSLTGWKEDFNMTFQQTVPAQRLALQYTRDVAMEYELPMRLGGHSKGGNLAVFAAARSGPLIQERIEAVYNNDGPGFTDYLMGDPGYLAIVPKVQTWIPQSSVIGMLLEHEEEYRVVRSKTVSLLQHDPYSWEVMGKGFVTMEDVTADSRFLDTTIKTWFAEMTNQERSQLVDVMFGLLGSGGADTVQDLINPKNIRTYIRTLSADVNLRRILSTEFLSLLEAAKKTRLQLEQGKDEVRLLEDGK